MSATIIEISSRAQRTAAGSVTEGAETAMQAELQRARNRIAQLERNLTQAMRDSLANFNRAREAEQQLAELGD